MFGFNKFGAALPPRSLTGRAPFAAAAGLAVIVGSAAVSAKMPDKDMPPLSKAAPRHTSGWVGYRVIVMKSHDRVDAIKTPAAPKDAIMME